MDLDFLLEQAAEIIPGLSDEQIANILSSFFSLLDSSRREKVVAMALEELEDDEPGDPEGLDSPLGTQGP